MGSMTTTTTITDSEALANAGYHQHRRGAGLVAAVAADHGITDDKGRKVGGFALVFRLSGDAGFGVMSYATRDGAAFGAVPTRWSSKSTTIELALEAGASAMRAQGRRYDRTLGVQAVAS